MSLEIAPPEERHPCVFATWGGTNPDPVWAATPPEMRLYCKATKVQFKKGKEKCTQRVLYRSTA
jgi:hypothetical protein